MGNPYEHQFSWWNRVKDSQKHELKSDCWYTAIRGKKWISLARPLMQSGQQNYTIDSVRYFLIMEDRSWVFRMCVFECLLFMNVASPSFLPGRKPAWFSCVRHSQTLDNRQSAMLASNRSKEGQPRFFWVGKITDSLVVRNKFFPNRSQELCLFQC